MPLLSYGNYMASCSGTANASGQVQLLHKCELRAM